MGHAGGRWFHHNLTGLEAEKLLLQKGVSGSFLARPSHSTPGSFTLSVRRGDEVTHIRIQNTEEFLDLYGGEKFATLSELVTYYMGNEGQLKEKNGDVIILKYPLFYEDPTKERWFHGRITGKQAEKMLLTKGTYGCFLVRESVHRPGSYVLSVLTGEQVAHIMIQGRPNGMYDVGGGHQFPSLKELINFYYHTPMVEKSGGLVPLRQPFNTTRFNVATIDQRIRQLEQESGQGNGSHGFSEEFEELHQEANLKNSSRDEGSMSYNREKNRYKNILPFDRTQVKLRDGDPNELGSDYINANYICWPKQLTESLSNSTSSLLNNMLNCSGTQQQVPSKLDHNHPITNGCVAESGSFGSSPLDAVTSAAAFFFNGKPRYIATQGVIFATQSSFWRMVWQERSAVIVMITKIVERGRNKCVRYWPTEEEGERVFNAYEYNLRVQLVSERNSTNYTLRELFLTQEPVQDPPLAPSPQPTSALDDIMTDEQNCSSSAVESTQSDNAVPVTDAQPKEAMATDTYTSIRSASSEKIVERGFTVYHYHFTVWPDHGTPSDPSCVLDFMHDISARQDSVRDAGPIIVHCSAGIGRTGTFIVIDMLINYIKTMGLNCDIDISRTIQMVREQRSGMVQTETQYRFIYKAVQQYVNTMSKRVKLDNDLRSTGRDYTNINRAADDVGTLATVGAAAVSVFSSTPPIPITTIAASSCPSSVVQTSVSTPSPAVSSSPPSSMSPSSPSSRHDSICVHSIPQKKKTARQHTGQFSDLGSSTPSISSSLTASSAAVSSVSSARTSTPGVTSLLHRLTSSGKSKPKS